MQGRLGRFANTKLNSDTFTASQYITDIINVLKTPSHTNVNTTIQD